MTFEDAYEKFMLLHVKGRSGLSLKRLTEDHGEAEKLFLQKVWWPVFSNFDHLVPEYGVRDFRDGMRFIDYAFLRGRVRLAIEIDGFESHAQKITRPDFSDDRTRQNHLLLDSWKLLRFSYDDVKDKPRNCEQTIQHSMGKWFGSISSHFNKLSLEERKIIRTALRNDGKIKPSDVCAVLDVEQQKARNLLRSMLAKGILIPGGRGTHRMHLYLLSPTISEDEYMYLW